LVGNAAGNVGPRRRALRGDELSDVVHGDNGALLLAALDLARESQGEDPFVPVVVDQLHLMLEAVSHPLRLRLGTKSTDLRHRLLQPAADKLLGSRTEQVFCRSVRAPYAPLTVERMNSCRDAGHHRLDEPATS